MIKAPGPIPEKLQVFGIDSRQIVTRHRNYRFLVQSSVIVGHPESWKQTAIFKVKSKG